MQVSPGCWIHRVPLKDCSLRFGVLDPLPAKDENFRSDLATATGIESMAIGRIVAGSSG